MDGHERWEHAFSGKSRPDNPRRPYLSLFFLSPRLIDPKETLLACIFCAVRLLHCAVAALPAVLWCAAGRLLNFFFLLTAAMRGGKRTQWTADG